MPVAEAEGHVGAPVHLARRHDIEHGQLLDGLGMIQRQAIGDAPAAVMPGDGEALEAELAHEGDLVARHGPLGIGLVIGRRRRLGAVAIAAQIRRDHGEVPRQPGRDSVPHDMGLGMAVQQQQRRAGPAMAQPDVDLAGLDGGEGEAFEHGRVLFRGRKQGKGFRDGDHEAGSLSRHGRPSPTMTELEKEPFRQAAIALADHIALHK